LTIWYKFEKRRILKQLNPSKFADLVEILRLVYGFFSLHTSISGDLACAFQQILAFCGLTNRSLRQSTLRRAPDLMRSSVIGHMTPQRRMFTPL
jgi:hypothetical protein